MSLAHVLRLQMSLWLLSRLKNLLLTSNLRLVSSLSLPSTTNYDGSSIGHFATCTWSIIACRMPKGFVFANLPPRYSGHQTKIGANLKHLHSEYKQEWANGTLMKFRFYINYHGYFHWESISSKRMILCRDMPSECIMS